MNPETKQALKESIEHWKRLASGNRKPGEGMEAGDCALCKMFLRRVADPCSGCPVRESSGHIGCRNTPFDNACAIETKLGMDSSEFKAVAEKELEFLKSLLPQDEP